MFDVAALRLRNGRLTGAPFATAAEAVAWFGAVQAQDFAGAKWGVAQRVRGAVEAELDRAYDAGEILRTHVLRPTWHFVAPADLRWLLALTAPRVKQAMATYDRKLGLDERTYARGHAAIARALEAGAPLTRDELARALTRAKLAASGQRLGHLMMRAELDAVICSGPRRGKQLTYALVTDRCPPAPALDRDDALGRLAARYVTSHGPALDLDFAWWSGLTLADARRGLALAGDALASRVLDGRTYWLAGAATAPRARAPVVHLLPNYDEYTVAYRHRTLALPAAVRAKLGARQNLLFNHLIMLDGAPLGAWRRTADRAGVTVTAILAARLAGPAQRALDAAVARLATFLGVPARLAQSA